MPRLTSCSDESSKVPEGKEWQVIVESYKPIPGQFKFLAIAGKQIVTIGRNQSNYGTSLTDDGRTATIVCPGTILEYLSIQLPLKHVLLDITIKLGISGRYICSPDLVSYRVIATGIEIEIKDIGKAWTRGVWRDLDVIKKTVEFVHTDCKDPFDEEALVWLVVALNHQIGFRLGM